ncbi:MAG TPA: BTAD domain-containing putative transcriptional regulator [Streptosporangiaceae bacterium]
MTMRIGLLGALQIRDREGRQVPVGGRRARMLVAMLALEAGHVVPVSSLIDRLWPDARPGDAANALQSLVSRLRARLRAAGVDDGAIESAAGGYRLAVAPGEVDALAFESLARDGTLALAAGDPSKAAALLDEALGTWRGPALAGVADEEFAVRPAARLEELREAATLDRIEAGLALGEGSSLLSEVRGLVAADPLAERPRALLMRALYADGRQAEALQVYQEAREALGGQLGVDPSPGLEQVYLGVLRQTLTDVPRPARAPATGGHASAGDGAADEAANDGEARDTGAAPGGVRPTNLREPLTSFVGRDADVERVLDLLETDRLVTLTGPGGVGKTRLASEAAATLAARRPPGPGDAPAGVWFVELAPVTCAPDVPYAVLDALGLRDGGMLGGADRGRRAESPDPAARLASALGARPALLVLDNCEHVVEAAAMLAHTLLAECARVRILATSREPLAIGGERLWSVAPLAVPPARGESLTPAEIGAYPAVRLLLDRAAAAQAGVELTAASAVRLARICRMLDGMPLAIELAAPRLRTLSPAQLAERLGDRFRLLTGGSRAAMPRHQTLRAVVDWSWDLLSEPERVLARRLAVFPGGTTLNIAERVCGGGSLPAEEVLPALAGLVDKSFLAVDAAAAAGPGSRSGGEGPGGDNPEPRYRMLETVRAYGLEQLAGAGEERRVRAAMGRYYLELAETADRLLRGPEQARWIRALIAEQENLYAALRWAVGQDDADTALRLAGALGWYWMVRGQRRESAMLAAEVLNMTAGRLEADPPVHVTDGRVICAICTLSLGGWDQDLAPATQALADAVAASQRAAEEHPAGRVHPVVAMAAPMLAIVKRDYEGALGQLSDRFDTADRWVGALARMIHAGIAVSLGRVDEAARNLDAAAERFRAAGDGWGAAMTLVLRSDLAGLRGDHLAAIRALDEAAAFSRELTGGSDLAYIYLQTARHRIRARDLAGAAADLRRSEQAGWVQGDGDIKLYLWLGHAELAWQDGQLEEASRLCAQIGAEVTDRASMVLKPFRSLVKTRLAMVTLRSGDVTGSAACLAEALSLASEGMDRPALAAVIDGIADLVLRRGGDAEAAELAATLLGAAHRVRGAFDHGSLDAPRVAEKARHALGDGTFDAACRRGRALSYDEALARAGQVLRR